ncbi:uncharacterized protein I206_106168 [Kwoniella pini CBS 10737]|uniref:A to I editase domain-containing protein n=1 Tax=Kwoniella pini CBS 10737 TaxID=1296096 RepID=A0A1B9I185_9TREE|nr:uncharacterized protein I206_04993 [Kwoniella pini CBS 10737]OCF49303.1 hypothetical protein I206_04993 [Kwoniella pini CBS 10737]
MEALRDAIVNSAHQLYASLPAHGKPVVRSNGTPEWTILSTISLVDCSNPSTESIIPISLGTGVKCLPYTKLSKYGDTLHDCHAEILARRGLMRWLLYQAQLYTRSRSCSDEEGTDETVYLELVNGRFRLKGNLQLWLYISMLPCGDASTFYTSSHQSVEEASQWKEADSRSINQADIHISRGRNGYTALSTLRTKPGRPDSIPSISMSCSDKIASWSILGIQGGLLSNIFEPIYLDGIIVGGLDTPSSVNEVEWREKIKREMERSIWGRLESIKDHIPDPYVLHRPAVHFSSNSFEHSKSTLAKTPTVDSLETSPSPLSISHLPFMPASTTRKGVKPEIIADGGALGHPWKKGKLIKEKGRSRICKLALLGEYERVIANLDPDQNYDLVKSQKTFYDYKHNHASKYQLVKSILRGIPKQGNTLKGLESFDEILSTGIADIPGSSLEYPAPIPPFKGWLVAGKPFESFTASGIIP